MRQMVGECLEDFTSRVLLKLCIKGVIEKPHNCCMQNNSGKVKPVFDVWFDCDR
jgi:hypothetical protein